MRDKWTLREAALVALFLLLATVVQADEPPNPPSLPTPRFPGDVAIMELEPGLDMYRMYDEEMYNVCYVLIGYKGYAMGCVPPKVETGLSAALLPLIAAASEQ